MQLEFDEKQAFLNIEAQLSGNMVEDSEEEPLSEDTLHPILYKLLQKLLLYPASDCLEAEWQRCNKAVDFMVLYCNILEGSPHHRHPKKTQQPMGSSGPDSDSNSKDVHMIRKQPSTYDELLCLTAEHIEKALKPHACFQCFADRKQPDEPSSRGQAMQLV
ncbi:hypothetical protein CIRG_09941 [Coccidioides immitis RMSCC 2394]|uniref:Uncharacterized protein n=1 Tax=Coccidioides immitis RMSCC 2394 TaxID=404692 RepID=A0A0J6YR23_COCIT|nr:hypothetical protein CIRG_09941 [Coccidioides immitis RMSCC 2394]